MESLEILVEDSAEAIPREAWSRVCPADHPFLNAHFLAIIERHAAAGPRWGWQAQHLVARDGGGEIVGVLPLYLKSNAYGDFIHDWTWSAAYRQFGRRYHPKALSGLPHTPVAGPRLLVDPDRETSSIRKVLIDAAKALVDELELSSWHIVLPAADERAPLRLAGLVTSHDVQFHWTDRGYGDFDGYLGAFAADKRRKIKAERRQVGESGAAIEVRHGDELAAEEWPALRALYASTFDKFGNPGVFTAACFAELAATLGRRMVVFIARADGRPIACAICFRSDRTLFGRYWGSDGQHPALHFELCFYQGIAYCLREGLRRFEPGAGGEHKLARGFEPVIVASHHWIADPVMRALIGASLEEQRRSVIEYRDELAGHLPFRHDPGTASPA